MTSSTDTSAATDLSDRIAASAATAATIPDTNPRDLDPTPLSTVDELSASLSNLTIPQGPTKKASALKAAKKSTPALKALFVVLDGLTPGHWSDEGSIAKFLIAAWKEGGCACGYDESAIYYYCPEKNWRVLTPMAFTKQWTDDVERLIRFYVSVEYNYGTPGPDDEDTVTHLYKFRSLIRQTTSRSRIQSAILVAVHETDFGLRFIPTPWVRDSTGVAVRLFTGETHFATSDDHILHPFGAAWDPDANADEWIEFFRNFAWCPAREGESPDEVTQRRQDRYEHILETIARYISGDYSDKSFTIIHGDGDNGKGILCKGLEALLGQTFKVASKGVFQATRSSSAGAATTQYNSFIDKRLAVHNETRSSACFNWEFIKTLTGNDKLPARELYHSERDIKVQTHILLLVNKVMNTRGADEAAQRRLRLFDLHFRYVPGARKDSYPEGQAWADPRAEERLLAPAALSGLFLLIVEASVRFAARGDWLMGPGNADAIEGGREYIEFFEATYYLVGTGQQANGRFADIPRTDVYVAYVEWCKLMNLKNDEPEMFYRNVHDTWSGVLTCTKTTLTINRERKTVRIIRGLSPRPREII